MDFLTLTKSKWFKVTALASLSVLLFSSDLEAQDIFSPGDLSKPHSFLSGLKNCDSCHGKEKMEAGRCLKCHEPLAERIRARQGFHGRSEQRRTECGSCHTEHMGIDNELIPWPKGGKNSFNHKETGWPLTGGHQGVTCAKCHEPNRLEGQTLKQFLAKNNGATTFLGVPKDCAKCHFDEHRGQLGRSCEKCHDTNKWKPPPKFDHSQTFALVGAHAKVPCAKCHKSAPGADSSEKPPTLKPRASTYLLMKPIAHDKCLDCHEDTHRNRFGSDCLKCHTQESWRMENLNKTAFHDKTEFPLKDRHRWVPCDHCHPKDKSGNKLLKPIAHDKCSRCHPSAHPDIPQAEMDNMDCSNCHSEKGFKPSSFTVDRHQKSRYKLDDAHLAAACNQCHVGKLGEPFKKDPVKRTDKKHLAGLVISPWRMRAQNFIPNDCGRCHESPHRDQFAGKACTECHVRTSWHISTFDHAIKTKFPLQGKHEKVRCGACHKQEAKENRTFTRYTPLPFDDCIRCHRDIHLGQFRLFDRQRPCADCHNYSGFKNVSFDHRKTVETTFPLKGSHLEVSCSSCHKEASLDQGLRAVRYRKMSGECEDCHEDEHKGAYKRAADIFKTAALPITDTEVDNTTQKTDRTACALCHHEESWQSLSFDHSETGFALNGNHTRVPCERCHNKKHLGNPPAICSACHSSPHRGASGLDCAECHTEEGFNVGPRFFARHNRTSFPLVGRHAALACTECHGNARDLTFDHTPTDCAICHFDDKPGPGDSEMDHTGISGACQQCHTPTSWKSASFGDHSCFAIGTVSEHSGVSCSRCHQGLIPTPNGNCFENTFSCTQCHGCETEDHDEVSGYKCEERRCARCHRNP